MTQEEADRLLKEVAEQVRELNNTPAIQRTYTSDRNGIKGTGKGYNTTGYGIDWLWELLINKFGPSYIRTTISDKEIEAGVTARGRDKYIVSLRATIQIADGAEILAECSAYGGHDAFLRGDALKGAETNAQKKALSKWGIGIDAYKGTLDDDSHPLPEAEEVPSTACQHLIDRAIKAGNDLSLYFADIHDDSQTKPKDAFVEYYSYELKGITYVINKKILQEMFAKNECSKRRQEILESGLERMQVDFPKIVPEAKGGF